MIAFKTVNYMIFSDDKAVAVIAFPFLPTETYSYGHRNRHVYKLSKFTTHTLSGVLTISFGM